MISYDTIKQKISSFTKLPVENIADTQPLSSLVADSFILVELMLTLQEEYAISLSQEEMESIVNVNDLIHLIQQKTLTNESLSIA